MIQFTTRLEQLAQQIEHKVALQVQNIEHIAERNQRKVIQAFQKHRVSSFHFVGSTGYGYNDRGREVMDKVYAEVFRTEAGLVRPHFVSGTHAIGTALFAVLRPGDELLYITGTPYDTLHQIIGKKDDGMGSLRDWGIRYQEVSLMEEGNVDWDSVRTSINERTKVIGIQRSRGYSWRTSFTVKQIGEMVQRVKAMKPGVVVFVDNCYGEFTELQEPTELGADIMVGSLIKNPGGGITETGGYIVGKRQYVEAAASRLTVPGIGREVGAMLGMMRSMYQGLFLASSIVGQAVRGSVFAAALFEELGFMTSPHWTSLRTDLIQAIRFHTIEHLYAFVQGIQRAAPVDAYVTPESLDMPGYNHPVIMAAGTFIQGGSLELSADAPIREPYIAYIQGGLTYAHAKLSALTALQTMFDRGLLDA